MDTSLFLISGFFQPYRLFAFFCYTLASWRITLRFLHFFQQDEYDNVRFLRWWLRNRSFERRASITSLVLFILSSLFIWFISRFYINLSPDSTLWTVANVIFGTGYAAVAAAGFSQRFSQAKKPLVLTSRAKRIFLFSLVIQLFVLHLVERIIRILILTMFDIFSVVFIFSDYYAFFIAFFLCIQSIPITLVTANVLLKPLELCVRRKYIREAKEILARVNPSVIGITGSYGKTSTKHILAHILECHARTLATPGSVNTGMGITRVIRERLHDDCDYFIVEMGAYGIGSIRHLCRLTPPKVAVVTGVGLAHLERFKSIETVARAKAELPEALPAGGIAVLNGDNPYCRNMTNDLEVKSYFYGEKSQTGRLDCRLVSAQTSRNGTQCRFELDNQTYEVLLPLFGKHSALNATAALLTGYLLGVPALTAIAAMKDVPQIAHRLVVNREPAGITTIDDAYNSNPDGFLNALEVLRDQPGNRKFLITPGMVELGEKEAEEHRRIAAFAAGICTVIVLIAPQRIPSLRAGLLENGFSTENLYEFDSLREARTWLDGQLQTGDVVLFENDLPDLYESPSAFA